ncbi:PAS domain S-box protein [Sphingomonas sp. MA1305]|uniref:PAS domain S-box protein n=1 Tax=Sphingomonas sp. MA1305 TaxID=2479204 RepID=UPI0018DF1529|nr:PAS domain S-box protein [Sphingomonas sp. MA1305]
MPQDRLSNEIALESAILREVERALRDERLLLASVLENLPLGIGVYDADGNVTLSNRCLRAYGHLDRLPSRQPAEARRWRAYDADGRPVQPGDYPGSRALRGERVMPGTDFLYDPGNAPERWMRISAVPFHRENADHAEAIVVVQDVDDLKRAGEEIEVAAAKLASQSRFVEATLSSIPDYVYAFDAERRFVYANPVMLGLFGLTSAEMLGRTFADLDYPTALAAHLNDQIDRIFRDAVTIEDEVFYESPTGHAAYFSYLWGPVRNEEGTVELVVGVSRDTSERRAFEEKVKRNEARLRAATELADLGIYAWDPVTGALDWDDRLRAMWGLPPGSPVDTAVYENGIHPEDLPRVRDAIAACVDPAGDGRYSIEYRVIGRDDGVLRHIATFGRTTFEHGRPTAFIGAAVDVSKQRRNEAAVRASEAQFRGFAENSSNLLWIVDPAAGQIVYRSAAFERIWGIPCDEAPTTVEAWMENVHADDRSAVARAMETVTAGEVVQHEYRIVRPRDGGVRWLRDTSFPIRDDDGAIMRIGGIAENLTQEDSRQVYIISARASEARRLARLVRTIDYQARLFDSADAFLDIAPVLAPGCVLVDLRKAREDGLTVPRELKARSIALPAVALDEPEAGAEAAVAAMKAGAIDYVLCEKEEVLRETLATALAECHATTGSSSRDEAVNAQIGRLTPREREVLVGLIDGGTNKVIAQTLGISPRTVELHRAQVMSKLGAGSLTELGQIALAAGLSSSKAAGKARKPT